ncbi:hypothetical protein IBA8401_21960 [Pseudomonas syringae]|uniref:glycosyltransferase family 2 protein n=1 Tax=Pseudomonas syringae TaxID=317 RepID=UPI0032E6F077
MINGQKVGCGIVTYNRPALLKKLYDSLPAEIIDCVVIINDGDVYPEFSAYDSEVFFNNETNLGVGKSKNRALSRLMDAGCEHLFLIEDDIYIKKPGSLRALYSDFDTDRYSAPQLQPAWPDEQDAVRRGQCGVQD